MPPLLFLRKLRFSYSSISVTYEFIKSYINFQKQTKMFWIFIKFRFL